MKSIATSMGETVIQRQVREKLGLHPGDRLRYVETVEGIVIEKARMVEDDSIAIFTEWASEADERAYADL